MLKSTDYKTKVMKPKDTEPFAELPVEPEFVKPVAEPKAEKPKSSTTSDRISALEAVVYSAFALNEDGTARKLKKKVKR